MGLFIVKNMESCIVNLLILKMLLILHGAVIGLTRSKVNSHPVMRKGGHSYFLSQLSLYGGKVVKIGKLHRHQGRALIGL